MADTGVRDVDRYLAGLNEVQRSTLTTLREQLRSVLPAAVEGLKYGMPCFVVEGKGIAGYAAFKEHCSYFPMSGSIIERAGAAAAKYTSTKGTLHFGLGASLPLSLVKRLVRLRLDEVSDVENGKRIDFFDDGRVKARGSMKNGQLHGNWEWFRADGSLMRRGRFNNGEKCGTWETWASDGTLVTSKKV